jgi:hypothetical protein
MLAQNNEAPAVQPEGNALFSQPCLALGRTGEPGQLAQFGVVEKKAVAHDIGSSKVNRGEDGFT